MSESRPAPQSHVFLGARHMRSERNVWAVIALCATMMVAEIGGGAMFGSIALVADGFHMSTHAGAMLLAALAYTLARRYAEDPRFTFGTGKFGDLAAFASAIILAMIAALIGFESIGRLLAPRPIAFAEAIPIAAIGLAVNLACAWLLTRDGDHHGHSHSHSHSHSHDDLHGRDHGAAAELGHIHPEGSVHRDNNLRAAVTHVVADAAVSILVIVGLLLARGFGWLWTDPVAGLIGAGVILSWSLTLIRNAGAALLDVNPDPALTEALRAAIEREGDALIDLHVWRLGPGHLGAILAVETVGENDVGHYRELVSKLARFSHLTIEIARRARSDAASRSSGA